MKSHAERIKILEENLSSLAPLLQGINQSIQALSNDLKAEDARNKRYLKTTKMVMMQSLRRLHMITEYFKGREDGFRDFEADYKSMGEMIREVQES